MTTHFSSIDEAFLALANPSSPGWSDAFRFLSDNPETAALMLDTFRETLEQMGVEPTGADPVTGEPGYSLTDVARAMGVPEDGLETAVKESSSGAKAQ